MGKFTKISQGAFAALQLDAGVLLYRFDPETAAEPADSDVICATSGGIKVSCVPTYSDMGDDVDNCPAGTMELKKLEGWNCRLAFASLSTAVQNIQLALGAADVDGRMITPRAGLEPGDFNDIWWVGDTANGGMVAIRLINALSVGGLELQTTKNGKGQIAVELMGHISILDPNVMPMEFYSTNGGVA